MKDRARVAQRRRAVGALCVCGVAVWALFALAPSVRGQAVPEIPLVTGMTFVLAVHAPGAAPAGSGIAQGDYEMPVTVNAVAPAAITLGTKIDALDERKQQLRLNLVRTIPVSDLADSRLQILGFHTNDAMTLAGTTALGPSLAIMRDLRNTGRASYSVRNFNHLSTSTGTLTRVSREPVPVPVLINGRRVELPAVHVRGQLAYGVNVRPWEQYLLDHPRHPLTLRFAVGDIGAGFPFRPDTTREIVRIDYPNANRDVEKGLATECRVEVPGIYFDFNRASLDPRSSAALTSIALMMRNQPTWAVAIEGHTDNVGSDAYNLDLSARRAEAVRDALVREHGVAAGRLTSSGFGESRPRETNDTIAGRARNRRVELVRSCGGRP